jgi:hypothetical protein
MAAGLRIYLDGERFGQTFRRETERFGKRVNMALRMAAKEAAQEIEERGRASIQEGGNFGSRWTEGFNATVSQGGGQIRIDVTEDVPYWRVFEYGATISAKGKSGYLWIPFEFADDAKGVWPRDYASPLFKVTRKSPELAMLWTWTPGEKDSAEPKYFGKESVTIPQKWQLRDIIGQVATELKDYYREHFSRS